MTKPTEIALEPEGTLLCQLPIEVRWGDMDALGHVNNTVYFRYFEQLRINWYDNAGYGTLGARNTGMVIVDAHAEFLKPIVYPAIIDARMGGHSPGRSSFVATYSLSIDDVVYTRGSSRIVWVDHSAGRSVPLPLELKQAIGGIDG